MYFSIIEGRSTDYITGLIIMSFCELFFRYNVLNYLFVIGAEAVGYTVLIATMIDTPNVNLLVGLSILGLLLMGIAIVKNISSLLSWVRDRDLTNANEELSIYSEELIALNDSLTNLTEQLNEALDSQRIFTASMNHELRTPLNGVMGCLTLLSVNEDLNEEQKACVQAAMVSSRALLQIVNDLLDYSKIEAGKFEIIEGNYDLREVITTSCSFFSNLVREKGLKMIVDVEDTTPCGLYGDGTRIQQVISNLLSNGCKYTHKGYVKLIVAVKDENLHIEVQDTGEGISDGAKEVLFKPFRRINEGEHKQIQGTGLGLYITYNLVTQMKGTISMQSEVGKGTTFTIDLPTRIVDRTLTYKRLQPRLQQKKDPRYVDFSKCSFLCVDDSEVNLIIFKNLVDNFTKAKVDTAESGIKCLELLKTNSYDVIFLDHMMPGMDGIETFARIREAGIDTPVVVLTANAGSKYMELYKKEGFDAFIGKPMKIEDIIAVVRNMLHL